MIKYLPFLLTVLAVAICLIAFMAILASDQAVWQ